MKNKEWDVWALGLVGISLFYYGLFDNGVYMLIGISLETIAWFLWFKK